MTLLLTNLLEAIAFCLMLGHLVQFRTHRDLQGSHIGGHIVCFRNVEAGER